MSETKNVKIVTADPSAIGLMGLAIITLVASSQKLGWTEGTSLIIPWALFLGAGSQLYAAIQDSKHNNTFGATAFFTYAMFWFAVGTTWLIQNGVFGKSIMEVMDGTQLGFVYLGYFIFTVFMTIGAMETHKVLFAIFFAICVLFAGLTLYSFNIAPSFSHDLAGWAEFVISMLSFYGCGASVLNTHFGKVFLPVGKPFGIFK